MSNQYLLHHFHDDCPGSSQDQVADCPVVVTEDVESIDRHHKLTDLKTDGQRREVLDEAPLTLTSIASLFGEVQNGKQISEV